MMRGVRGCVMWCKVWKFGCSIGVGMSKNHLPLWSLIDFQIALDPPMRWSDYSGPDTRI